MRVHRVRLAALTPGRLSRLSRLSRLRLAAIGSACAAVAVAAPVTVLLTAGSASAQTTGATATSRSLVADTPPVARVALTAATTVTKGQPIPLAARLNVGPLQPAGRKLQFVARTVGSTTWTSFATATTDRTGWASITSRSVTRPTEFGAYYSDAAGAVHSDTATAVVHTIDMAPHAPSTVAVNAPVTIAGHLLKDGVHGLASQPVKVWLRTSPKSAWSSPLSLRTNARGVATLAKRFTRTTQVGIRFPGASGLAASPLAIATVTVKAVTATVSGFVFPFANPRQAESMGNWSQDQGVDIAARGYACGASVILVAVGDGVVIQEGISGFGPTAPVIRMTSGPFRGRNVYYGHTGHVYVGVGAHVRAGQRLAQIGCGSVGYSSAPHLEIGVGVPGGPPCCPSTHQTSPMMLKQLTSSLRAALA